MQLSAALKSVCEKRALALAPVGGTQLRRFVFGTQFRWFVFVGVVTTIALSSPVLATSVDCTDDKEFRYLSKERKDCHRWVSKQSSTRCDLPHGDGTVAGSCRRTCDYNYCRTIEDGRKKLLVGAYYYPWHGADFHGRQYLREKLIGPKMEPELGEYDDTHKSVIAKHLSWSRTHNVGLWVASWWGEDMREDLALKNNIFPHPQLREHKVALFYETMGRLPPDRTARSDLRYICTEYFGRRNYYTAGVGADGAPDATSASRRPVLFVYLTRLLEQEGRLARTVDLMRKGARDGGCGEIFLVGDHVFGENLPPPTDDGLAAFDLLDAVTNYDVYGWMGRGYAGSRAVSDFYSLQNRWKGLAKSRGCAFIPPVSPGYNDMGIRPEAGHAPLSRRLTAASPEGSLFREELKHARTVVDSDVGNLIMVNSWNEWHEDTQIEPCVVVDGGEGGKKTDLPTELTNGLVYKGYGSLYLKILKKETKKWKPSMVVPVPTVD